MFLLDSVSSMLSFVQLEVVLKGIVSILVPLSRSNAIYVETGTTAVVQMLIARQLNKIVMFFTVFCASWNNLCPVLSIHFLEWACLISDTLTVDPRFVQFSTTTKALSLNLALLAAQGLLLLSSYTSFSKS